MATGRQLRDLFATLLCDCTPSDPLRLWMDFWDKICDDLQHRLQIQNIRQNPTPEDTYDFGLFLIEEILQRSNKSLLNWPMLPLPQQNWEHALGNQLIAEQCNYNTEQQAQYAADCFYTSIQNSNQPSTKLLRLLRTKLDKPFFCMDQEKQARPMSTILSAIFCVVKEKLFCVLLYLELLHCFLLVVTLHTPALKFLSIFMNRQCVESLFKIFTILIIYLGVGVLFLKETSSRLFCCCQKKPGSNC